MKKKRKTRKNIRRMITYKELDILTKAAEKNELYRKLRVKSSLTRVSFIRDIIVYIRTCSSD